MNYCFQMQWKTVLWIPFHGTSKYPSEMQNHKELLLGLLFPLKDLQGLLYLLYTIIFFLYCFQELKATCSCRLRSLRYFVELYSCTSNSSSEYVLWNDLLLHSVEQFDTNSSPLSSITTCVEQKNINEIIHALRNPFMLDCGISTVWGMEGWPSGTQDRWPTQWSQTQRESMHIY